MLSVPASQMKPSQLARDRDDGLVHSDATDEAAIAVMEPRLRPTVEGHDLGRDQALACPEAPS
jgi:hypothetical protein